MSSIIVLESPWKPGAALSERMSVVPFFQGMANTGMVDEIFSATFYDANTFNFALSSFINSGQLKDPILYIASHGTRGRVATNEGMKDMNISNLIATLSVLSEEIKGVVLGCCSLGGNKKITDCFDEKSKLSWIYGYSCNVDWYYSTIVDVSVIYSMLNKNSTRGLAIDRTSDALKMFNPDYIICDENDVKLRDAFRFYVNDGRLKEYDVTSKVINSAW